MQNGPTDFSGDSDEGNNQQSADVDFSDDSGTDDALLEFDKMVLNPGTAHITHNAANTLEEVMPTYKMRTHQLGAVCDLCREQKHRPRLEQTCFSDGVGKTMWQDFTGFSGKVRRHRFATTSFSIPQALKVGPHLRSRWNPQAYLASKPGRQRKRKSARQEEEEQSCREFVEVLTTAIETPLFWAWLVMANEVAGVIRFVMAFMVSCSCHWQLYKSLLKIPCEQQNELYWRLLKLCKECPGGGRRTDSLSTGLLFDELREEASYVLANIDKKCQAISVRLRRVAC